MSTPDPAPNDYGSVEVVGLDADDTLWHSEIRFQETNKRFHELLAPHVAVEWTVLEQQMLVVERDNLRLFGYGATGYTLSLIETAIELTGGQIPAADIAAIVAFGKDLLDHPVDLLPGVSESIDRLDAAGKRLVLITKGDLLHQESKVAASGLADRFDTVEIVSEKDPATYRRILDSHDIAPASFCMIGNSARSDVLPVIEVGGSAIHVPHDVEWAHEAVDGAEADSRFATVGSLDAAVDLLV